MFVKFLQRRGPAFVVLILSLIATGVAWQYSIRVGHEKSQEYFESKAGLYKDSIAERMGSYEEALKGVQALFNASANVDRSTWRRYYDSLNLAERLPGILGAGYSVLIDPNELSDHIKKVREEGFPQYSVRPAGSRNLYTSIIFVEPFDEISRRALGFDMYAEPVRRQAMQLARDRGETITSGKITLVQESQKEGQAGFLLYLPVYSTKNVPDFLGDRRRDLQGYVFGAFRAIDLIDGILGDFQKNDSYIRIYDESIKSEDTLLYDSYKVRGASSEDYASLHRASTSIWRNGRTWQLEFHSTRQFDAYHQSMAPPLVLMAGVLLSMMLFFISWTTANTKLRARRLASVNQNLAKARELADQANQAKSAFLATMSHEIRTPMNGVLGMAEILANSELSEGQTDCVRTIRHSGASLLRLIDDILDFSKIEAGRLELERTEVSINGLFSDICTALDSVAERKRVDLHLFVAPGVPDMVWSDPTRLRQVLFNLVGNAIKFSSGRPNQRGLVKVRLEVSSQKPLTLRCKIIDNGIGMTSEALENMFKVFTQAEVSTTRRFGGSGLGLAICDRLVGLMNGSIAVTSEPDLGSTFTIEMPFDAVQPQPAIVIPELRGVTCIVVKSPEFGAEDLQIYLEHAGARVKVVSDAIVAISVSGDCKGPVVIIQDENFDVTPLRNMQRRSGEVSDFRNVVISSDHNLPAQEGDKNIIRVSGRPLLRHRLLCAVAVAVGRISPDLEIDNACSTPPVDKIIAPSVSEARRSGQLILVAEDEPVNQKVILRQLALLGYAAEVCNDGQEALAMWQEGEFALVITDLHMPNMDGYTLAESIRKQESGASKIPVLALTANALKGEEVRALAIGMNQYLTKPLQLDQLRAALERWMPGRVAEWPQQVVETKREAVSKDSVMDISVLKDLVGGDEQIVQEILQDYLGTSRQLPIELRAAHKAGDMQRVAEIAHKLKSSSRSIGALAFGDLCAELENAGKASDASAVAGYLAEFEQTLIAIRAQIDEIVETTDAAQS